MRLLGYPAASISVLTTYNGQKALLRDVIERRCANNPLFGRPHKVATVDKYQGQQNQYVLLSLVRTRAVGHLRDPRRLVVAMSRARLGLYIFGRAQLFAGCYELQPTFKCASSHHRLPGLYHWQPAEHVRFPIVAALSLYCSFWSPVHVSSSVRPLMVTRQLRVHG